MTGANGADFKGQLSKMEYTSWALQIYFMNSLIEELDVWFESITTEASRYFLFPPCMVVSPNSLMSSSLGPVMIARASLAAISK